MLASCGFRFHVILQPLLIEPLCYNPTSAFSVLPTSQNVLSFARSNLLFYKVKQHISSISLMKKSLGQTALFIELYVQRMSIAPGWSPEKYRGHVISSCLLNLTPLSSLQIKRQKDKPSTL